MATYTVIQWRSLLLMNGVPVQIPEGLISSEDIDSTAAFRSAVIDANCTVVEVIRNDGTQGYVNIDYTATPDAAAAGDIPVISGIPRFIGLRSHPGTMKIAVTDDS